MTQFMNFRNVSDTCVSKIGDSFNYQCIVKLSNVLTRFSLKIPSKLWKYFANVE